MRKLVGMFVVLAGLGGGSERPAHAQAPDSSVGAQADWAVHGPDGEGKDGPMSALDRGLVALYYRYQAYKEEAQSGDAFADHANMPVRDSLVTIDAIASGSPEALLDSLKRLGIQEGAQAERLVSGHLPIGALQAAAQLPELQAMRPAQTRSKPGAKGNSIVPSADASESQPDDSKNHEKEIATSEREPPSGSASTSHSESTAESSPSSDAGARSEAKTTQDPSSDSSARPPMRRSDTDSVVEQSTNEQSMTNWHLYVIGGGILMVGIGALLMLRRRSSHAD